MGISKSFLVVMLSGVLLAGVTAEGQTVRYVNSNGDCAGSTPCYASIQGAIDASSNGDEIVVQPGTYYETINFNGKAINLHSSDGPAVTIIDANSLGTVVTCAGGEGPETMLQGFTITGGYGNSASGSDSAGGMYNYSSSPTVTNCIFSGNTAVGRGGGMYNGNSAPTVTNCTFRENASEGGGGMVNQAGSNPIVENCRFITNTAIDGGGIFGEDSTVTVINSTFDGNRAEGSIQSHGGGVVNGSNNATRLVSCKLLGNHADDHGGGIHMPAGTVIVINSMFSGNDAEVGGGIHARNNTSPQVSNCTFSLNAATEGGAIYSRDTSSPTVTNCVVWGNSGEALGGSGIPNVTYSCVEGGCEGIGNIDADPLFVDSNGLDDIPGTEDDNLRLLPGSPCIDAGSNGTVPPDTLDLDNDGDTDEPIPFDLDGNPRIVDGDADGETIVDMGAYEYLTDCNTNGIPDPCDLDCGTNGGPCDIPGCGESEDCNTNNVPDECDIAAGTSEDCQPNGIPDECDILPPVTTCCEAHPEPGCDSPSIEACVCLIDPYCCDTEWDRVCVDEVTSEGCGLCDNDCNTNSIPDDCEPDFDGDGLIDDCDSDIDDDGVPNGDDVCDYTPLGAVNIIMDAASSLYGTIRRDLDGDCDCDLADFAKFIEDGLTGPNG